MPGDKKKTQIFVVAKPSCTSIEKMSLWRLKTDVYMTFTNWSVLTAEVCDRIPNFEKYLKKLLVMVYNQPTHLLIHQYLYTIFGKSAKWLILQLYSQNMVFHICSYLCTTSHATGCRHNNNYFCWKLVK